MAIKSDILFVNGDESPEAQQFGEKRKLVEELPDNPESAEDDETEPKGEGGDKKGDGLEEMDVLVAKLLLTLLDDSRSGWLSVYAYGNITQREKYRYYKDLNTDSNKALVNALAIVVRKYRLSDAPEAIILISIAVSTWFLYQMAKADKEEFEQKKAELQQKQQLLQQQQQQVQQQTKGKIIKLNNTVNSAQI